MGPVYFGYASRYPMYFNYRRGSSAHGFGEVCTNHLALSNGSYAGTFHCPFLPDEPRSWTKCCGFDGEGFCCDPDYNDWQLASARAAILAIIGGVLLTLGLLIALLVYCCCCSKKRGGSGGAGASAAAAGSSNEPVGVTNPVKPPYPTMEYGTVQPPPGSPAAGSAPYPPPQPPPYRPRTRLRASRRRGADRRAARESTAELVWICR
uniref:Uncharacterized protein n=1 Tax=Macrostomum lignano TaxID=282301 RepID=A0A1I8INQ7_9PLAT